MTVTPMSQPVVPVLIRAAIYLAVEASISALTSIITVWLRAVIGKVADAVAPR